MLRELRKARHLTLAAVAGRAGCAESLISYVESGQRKLAPWLASKLDDIYRTGGVVATLMHSVATRPDSSAQRGVFVGDTLVVELPEGGVLMPLPRRELLASLGIGIAGSKLLRQFESALDNISLGDDTLGSFEAALEGFQVAARTLPPSKLIDGLTGNVAILDSLRRRAGGNQRQSISRLQARYAESLSWLSEEAGDLAGAMYWIDRASQWGHAANWSAMSAYGFVRRSMIVISFTSDGQRAIGNAQAVLEMPDAPPRVQGLAAKQIAFGHALTGNEVASSRALDRAMNLLSKPADGDDAILGQRSVVSDDLFAIFRATCDIYLGRGERVVPILEPRLTSLSASSLRTATITRAKLIRAYANAGQPDEAARMALVALDDSDRLGSLSARSELRRAMPLFQRWHGREEVQAVLQRLTPNA